MILHQRMMIKFISSNKFSKTMTVTVAWVIISQQ